MWLEELKPNPDNPRQMDEASMRRLMESIQRDPEYMVLRPIVHRGGLILGGNQRWEACRRLGMTEIPDTWAVDAASLTEEQARRFVLVDNAPPGASGGWDWEVLRADWTPGELAEFGLSVPGTGNSDLSGLFGGDDGGGDEPPKDPQVKCEKCPNCGKEFVP